jgi:hypothetical protein
VEVVDDPFDGGPEVVGAAMGGGWMWGWRAPAYEAAARRRSGAPVLAASGAAWFLFRVTTRRRRLSTVQKKGASGARPTGPNLGLTFKLLGLAGPENRPSCQWKPRRWHVLSWRSS